MKLATWNVNSLRVRLDQLLGWLDQTKPDIVALQETKVTDQTFPKMTLESAGYHVIYSGQKTYNGVAILSRKPMQDVITNLPGLEDESRRVLGATIGDIRLLNLYVPNGQSVESQKYAYKLQWLEALRAYVQEELKVHQKLIVAGDFNIAPEDCDVYDPKAWEGNVLISPKERKSLQNILDLGLTDAFRLFDQPENSYSWWDYRHMAFRRNMGLRLDLILISKMLVKQCQSVTIDKSLRALERPSDHAPVVAEFR